MNAHKLFYIIGFLLVFKLSFAQMQDARLPVIELHTYAGQLMPHNDRVRSIHNHNMYQACEVRIGLQTSGEEAWHHYFNFPIYGFGAYWGNFNNPIIGQPLALFSYIDIPIYTTGNFQFSSNWALGLSFNFNEYDVHDAQPNLAIGTDKNAFIAFALASEYLISPKWSVALGFKAQHFSNGCIQRPNLGLNLFNGELALRYYMDGKLKTHRALPIAARPKKWNYSIMYAAGLADISDDSDIQYYCSTTTADVHYTLNRKRTIGFGLDAFYREYLKDDPDNVNAHKYLNQMSFGVHVSSEYLINKVHAYVQLGTYLWRPYAYEVPFYERLGIRYHFINERCFANVAVLAHDIRALYTEWGLGWVF